MAPIWTKYALQIQIQSDWRSHHARARRQATAQNHGQRRSSQRYFLADQLSAAIASLESAVAQEEVEGLQDPKQISLRQRSLPMLKMLKQCLSQSADVVWGRLNTQSVLAWRFIW